MAMKSFKFNKSNLGSLVSAGTPVTVRDTEVTGLRFKTGVKRSVFSFEKRICGRKGAPITFTIGAFPAVTIDDARREARRLANLCEQGIDPRKQKKAAETCDLPLQTAVDKFYQVKESIAKCTFSKYRSAINNHFPAEWFGQDISAITPDMLVAHFHSIRSEAKQMGGEFLKVYRNIWNTCAPLFLDGDGKRILGPNPVDDAQAVLKYLPSTPRKRSVIAENTLGKFVVVVEQMRSGEIPLTTRQSRKPGPGVIRMCDIAPLTLFTAFRFNEARQLKWEYVDLEHAIIRLPGDAKAETGDFDGTKNHLDHWVPLSSYALDLLKKLHQERSSVCPYVFPALRDITKPITRNNAVFKRISELIGSHYSPHASRRTFASAADEVGLGFLTVKRMLNHAYQGGVTGGYVVPGFNPAKERGNFQKVCDFILDRRSEYLGFTKAKDDGFDQREALLRLKRFALEQGLDPMVALEALAGEVKNAAA